MRFQTWFHCCQIHRDDPSALYYTVNVGADTAEKQTDGKRLEKVMTS